MKFEENKGVIALVLLAGIAIGGWSAGVTLLTLVLSLPVVLYSGLKHEPWFDNLFEP